MTQHLLKVSNARVWCALPIAQACRHDLGAMAELRDAFRQRQSMRDAARFSLWFMANEERLRDTFSLRRARRELETTTGNTERDFSAFVHRQFRLDNLKLKP